MIKKNVYFMGLLLLIIFLVTACTIEGFSSEKSGEDNIVTGESKGVIFNKMIWEIVYGDFNNDGKQDEVVQYPFAAVDGVPYAGAILVKYSGTDLTDSAIHQNSPGVEGMCEEKDSFGIDCCVGDFNSDGYDDLGVGSSYESIGTINRAGMVTVLYGGPIGLSGTGSLALHQNKPGVAGVSEEDDTFGRYLAAGDFNGDGFDDLAVGAPGEDIGDINAAGCVAIFYGSASGIMYEGNTWLDMNTSGMNRNATLNEYFGTSLHAGDFDNDGYDELIACTDSSINPEPIICVLYGSESGITTSRLDIWSEERLHIPDNQKSYDFSQNIVVTDIDNNGCADLFVGAPYFDYSGTETGIIYILRGISGIGIKRIGRLNKDFFWDPDEAETKKYLGKTLSLVDYNDDGFMDVKIGYADYFEGVYFMNRYTYYLGYTF